MPKSTVKRNLSHTISGVLRQEILENQIPKGEHMNEALLADRFGVSRGPVREAIQELTREGFVITQNNGRAIADGFSKNDMDYYYRIRLMLESKSIELILDGADSPDYGEWISGLEEILNQSRIYLLNDDHDRFTQLDSEFHYALIERANIKIYMLIWNMLDNLNKSIMEVNRKNILNMKLHDPNVTYAFHDSILHGLRSRDYDFTLSSLTVHLKKGYETYSEIIEKLNKLLPKDIDASQRAILGSSSFSDGLF